MIKSVGRHLGICGTDPTDIGQGLATNVIIGNQLEPSDHSHLGRLLVYASGFEASTAIWITTCLREAYRLRWSGSMRARTPTFERS
jgi:hypothetical protein